jgi:hypothetical protein
MAQIQAIADELRSAILTQWPEVAASGVWEDEQLENIPLIDIAVPFAAFTMGEANSVDDYCADTIVLSTTCNIYYIDQYTGDATTLRSKIEGLADYLYYSAPLTLSQAVDVPKVSVSNELPPNKVFSEKAAGSRAGCVTVTLIYGKHP